MYETGGMRRTHLRGHNNILKRLIVHAGAFNPGMLMRRQLGVGTPRGLQDRGIVIFAAQMLSVIAPTVVRGPGEPFRSRFSKRQPNRCDFSRPGYDSRAA